MNKFDCIVFDKVTISYGAEQAVRDVSFSVPNGEVFAIVGESGSGKSTLVRAAFGMLKQANVSGQILLNGTDVSTLSDGDWRQLRGTKISMIFQNPSAYLNRWRTYLAVLSVSVERWYATTVSHSLKPHLEA